MVNMDPYAYLTVKFVSKAFNTATKKSDGTELVTHGVLKRHVEDRHSGGYVYFSTKESAFAPAMARIEADLSTKLRREKLMCSNCGYYKTKGCHGFCDEEFQQTNAQRLCGSCLPRTKPPRRRNAITIRGKPYFLCLCCWRINRKESGFTPEDMAAGLNGTYLNIVLKDSKLAKQKSKDRICGICFKRIAQKAMTEWVKTRSSAEPTSKAKSKKRRREESEDEDDDDDDRQNDDGEINQIDENEAEDDNENEDDEDADEGESDED